MATTRFDPFGYADTAAEAQRVMLVDGSGEALDPGAGGGVARASGISRVATATTTAITAGARSYSVTVIAAASAASPTLDGVAIPQGVTVRFEADGDNTLDAASLVTVSGDDCLITEVR